MPQPVRTELDDAKDTITTLNQQLTDLAAARAKDLAAGAKALVDLRTQLTAQADADKQKAIADLKATVLVPALKNEHARQAAELAAKQAAELAALNAR